MIATKKPENSRFDVAVDIADLPVELHQPLRECAALLCEFVVEDGSQTGGRYVAIDFEGAADDSTPESVVRQLLAGKRRYKEYPYRDLVLTPAVHLPEPVYAGHLLATRYLRERLSPHVVHQERVAIHVHA